MDRISLVRILSWACVIFSFGLVPANAGAPESLESWLSDDVVGYVKLKDLGARVDEFLASPLRAEFEATALGRYLLASAPSDGIRSKLAEFRNLTGKDALDVLREVLGREAVVGIRLGFYGPEFVLLARLSSQAALDETWKAFLSGVEKQFGQPIQPLLSTYAARSIETVGPIECARIGEVLVASNSRRAVESTLDLVAGKSTASARSAPAFQGALTALGSPGVATLVLRPRFVPMTLPLKFAEPIPGFLFAGWVDCLRSAEALAVGLDFKAGGLHANLAVQSSGDSAADEAHVRREKGFFPEAKESSVVDRLGAEGFLASLEVRRDLLALWKEKGAILEPVALNQLSQFSQTLAMLFGGKSLESDILPALKPTLTLLARNQTYAGATPPRPAIPGIAGVFEVADGVASSDAVLSAFDTAAHYFNVDRTQKGLEPGSLAREEAAGARFATLSLPADEGSPGVHENFSPTACAVGSFVIFSSSKELCRDLARGLEKPSPSAKPAARDRLIVGAEALRDILRANRESLLEDSMAKKAQSREAAAKEVDAVLEALGLLGGLRISSGRTSGGAWTVDLELSLSGTSAGAKQARS